MKLRVGLILLTTMVLGGMLLSGVGLAVTKTCNNNCKGANSPDSLKGDNSKNEIHALGGGDVVKGNGGTDWLYGESGADELSGGSGVDGIYGGTGYDWLNGKRGADHVEDIQKFGPSSTALQKQRTVDARIGSHKNRTVDVLIGDRGNDTIKARDGKKDIIRGGPGYDKAYVDRVDKVTGVEKEVVPGGGGGTGGGTPQPKQCNDGKDNDGDGKTDGQDPGCASATDDTENSNTTLVPQKKQCNDGKDNDNDGKIDFGTQNPDPGCDSATDDSENTAPVANDDDLTTYVGDTPENQDVIDNDTDVEDDNQSLSVSDFTQPSHGQVTQNSPRSLKYTLDENDPALVCDLPPCPDVHDSFDYTVSDSDGGTDTGTVSVTIDVTP